MAARDWADWHRDYDADTPLARRLAAVQRHIRTVADGAPPGPIRVVSMCAGEGRDLIGALADHPRRSDVRGRLVELDPRNVAVARASAVAAGMEGIHVMQGDAGATTAYAGAVPADLLLVCGVYGNVPDADVRATIEALPSMAAAGATTIWTRSRRDPDLTPTIRGWYREAGFEELSFEPISDSLMSVGAWRFTAEPRPFRSGLQLFSFVPEKRAGPVGPRC